MVEDIIDEADDEEDGELIEELNDRTEPLTFGIMSWESGEEGDGLEERTELLVLETVVVERIYIPIRIPAPLYSYWFPGQIIKQSVKAAGTKPALIVLLQ